MMTLSLASLQWGTRSRDILLVILKIYKANLKFRAVKKEVCLTHLTPLAMHLL